MRQRGLSLIELLVAMALGLLLLAGVIQVVLSSKRSYQSGVALAELQESGRFALEVVAQDLRNAGFTGARDAGLPVPLCDLLDRSWRRRDAGVVRDG
ncbi:MAG: prepilin-type N-terminal cleavage/methylation domain-containing protein [Pseudomonas sp.]